jgi:hypothetical protein
MVTPRSADVAEPPELNRSWSIWHLHKDLAEDDLHPDAAAGEQEVLTPRGGKANVRGSGPPIRTLEFVRAKFIQALNIDALKQTFMADVFFEFCIRGGALDPDLTREGDGPPSGTFPGDTLRPSARWYLNQLEFSNSLSNEKHSDTCVVTRGNDLHLRFRATGEFSEQLEFDDFPFDTQELTVKLIMHCVLGGFVAVEFVPPGFTDEFTAGPDNARLLPRDKYQVETAIHAPPLRIPKDHFKVDSFHLHNVWDLSTDLSGAIGVHAHEVTSCRSNVGL